MTEKVFISYADLHKDLQDLSNQITNSKENFEGLLIISRGGLVPGGILSYSLNIKRNNILPIASYEADNTQSATGVKVLEHFDLSSLPEDVQYLVVDDLVDTGATMEYVKKILPSAKSACPYIKPKGREYVDFYSREFTQDQWLVFPWDV